MNNLIIGTQHAKRFLCGGESVHFYIIQALKPLWVTTPFAVYPLLPHEELTVTMPDRCCVFPISFTCGDERVSFRFFVS